mgnify:CR=1 FL=1|tara:strand:- start:389 stop:715 length:327 start_codon:yes stop_codon:yes gene_type:complete
MRKVRKQSDGKYHVDGKVFDVLVGTRAQVLHGTAYKTSGGLLAKDLVQNKNGRIVSKKKHVTAKRERRLEKHGFYAQKGKFGYIKKTARRSPPKVKRARTIGGTRKVR